MKVCEWCSVEFEAPRKVCRFCSRNCSLAWMRSRKPQGVTLHDHVCEVCGKQFATHKRTQRTCGLSCRGSLGRSVSGRAQCPCGAEIDSRRTWCETCSHEQRLAGKRQHYYRNRDSIRRRNTERYAANRESYRAIATVWRETNNFNGLRRNRLAVDDYQCQRCAATEDLVVHHLNRREDRDEPDRTSTLDDLLTLCRACHMTEHRRLGHLAS